MKKDVIDYLAKFMECLKVKDEKKHPVRLLQPFLIPDCKWEVVTIDFITKFPRTTRKHDSIKVVMGKLTKIAHFILVKVTHKAANIEEIYMREIDRLHGVPKKIVSNQYLKFTSNFWKDLFKGFGADLNFNTTY
jgi:hypothetical protein